MAKRQVFEAPPRTELIGSCICAKEQVLMTASVSGEQEAYMFAAPSFSYFIEQLHVPESLTNLVEKVIGGFFDIIWKSGV